MSCDDWWPSFLLCSVHPLSYYYMPYQGLGLWGQMLVLQELRPRPASSAESLKKLRVECVRSVVVCCCVYVHVLTLHTLAVWKALSWSHESRDHGLVWYHLSISYPSPTNITMWTSLGTQHSAAGSYSCISSIVSSSSFTIFSYKCPDLLLLARPPLLHHNHCCWFLLHYSSSALASKWPLLVPLLLLYILYQHHFFCLIITTSLHLFISFLIIHLLLDHHYTIITPQEHQHHPPKHSSRSSKIVLTTDHCHSSSVNSGKTNLSVSPPSLNPAHRCAGGKLHNKKSWHESQTSCWLDFMWQQSRHRHKLVHSRCGLHVSKSSMACWLLVLLGVLDQYYSRVNL